MVQLLNELVLGMVMATASALALNEPVAELADLKFSMKRFCEIIPIEGQTKSRNNSNRIIGEETQMRSISGLWPLRMSSIFKETTESERTQYHAPAFVSPGCQSRVPACAAALAHLSRVVALQDASHGQSSSHSRGES